MTREQAKIYAKLSREELKIIDEGYANNYDIICAFANGAEIQIQENGGKWIDCDEPYFYSSREYRVKPSASDAAQPSEPWKPKLWEVYFCVGANGEVFDVRFDDDKAEMIRIAFGNCFRTRAEAEAARERVSYALKDNNYVYNYVYVVKDIFEDYSEYDNYFDIAVFRNKKEAEEFLEKRILIKLKEMEEIQRIRDIELETFRDGKENISWGCELRDDHDYVEVSSRLYLTRVPVSVKDKTKDSEEIY